MSIAYTFLMLSGRSWVMLHLKSETKARCQQIINKQNEILKSRGLRWSLPKEFPNWIELHKDYQNPKIGSKQGQRAPSSQDSTSSISQSEGVILDMKTGIKHQQNFFGRAINEKYAPLDEDNDVDSSAC